MHHGSLDELRHWDALDYLAGACAESNPRADAVWVRAAMDRLDPGLRAGWKIHVSSVPTVLLRVLEEALPALRAAQLPFKVIRTAETLERMNDGRFGLTQVGKAMTIYPPDEETGYRIANTLSAALRGFPGPYIPSDTRFCPDAPVYCRFGAFDARFHVDDLGQERRIFDHPERGEMLDTTDGGEAPTPRFLPMAPPYDHLAFLRERFLPVRMLQVSAKGAAFLAIEKKTPSTPPLFIKTAKAHTHSDLCGRDALWALEREHGLLRRLAGLPGVLDAGVFVRHEDETGAIVRPYIEGRLWWDVWTRADARTPETRRELHAALRSLAALVRACHERGIVIRDLSPGNILIAETGVYVLDFELAHDLADPQPGYRRGTLGFFDPTEDRFRVPSVQDDAYALLALALMAHTGLHPAWLPGGLGEYARNEVSVYATPEFHACWMQAYDVRHDAKAFAKTFERVLEVNDGNGGWEGRRPRLPFNNLPCIPVVDTCSRQSGASALPSAILGAEHAFWDDVTAQVAALPETEDRVGQWTVYSGLSGILLCAMEWDRERALALFSEDCLKTAVSRLSDAAERVQHIPGLYFGASGIALALWTLGSTRNDKILRETALGIFEATLNRAIDSRIPDLCHGWAGFASTAISAHAFAPDETLRAFAEAAGQRLLGLAQENGDGALEWPWPEGPYGTMPGARLYGFAHGTAGVAHTLFRLHELLPQSAYLDAAERGIETLRRAARPVTGNAVWWPVSEQEETVWNAWCHGTPGVAKALAQALAVRDNANDRELLIAALEGISCANNSGWCLCHGVASRLDAFVDARAVLDGPTCADWAERDAALLSALRVYALEKEQCNGEAGSETGGLMTGAAGVVRTLSRYAHGGRASGVRLLP